jgi:hypothetical protein
VANHLLCEHLGFVGRVDYANASLQTIIKGALASAASKDLGLDNHIFGADLFCDSFGLGGGLRDGALRNLDAILYEVSD